MIEYILTILVLLRLYNYLNFFLIRKRIKGPAKIIPGWRPFEYKKGKTVALLIHGFTSSPKEMRKLGKYLAQHNISVSAPLLAGHGTSPERLAIVKAEEWIHQVNTEIKKLEKEFDSIYIIGNSFGGNLALLAGTKSKKVKGIVTIGTPMIFYNEHLTKYILLPILKRIKIFQKKRYKTEHAKNLVLKNRNAYQSIPLKSAAQFSRIVDKSKAALSTVDKPILILQSAADFVIKPDSADFIHKNVKSKRKKIVMIPDSYHNMLIDKSAARINKEILAFLRH